MDTIYITYGCGKHFDINKFDTIENRDDIDSWINKPNGGLWAADVKSDQWLTFCKNENFKRHYYNKNNCFKFKLSNDAKILKIHNATDFKQVHKKYKLHKLNVKSKSCFSKYILDFKKIAKDYDVIDYVDRECQSYMPFWDIDCILILNPKKVRPID